MASGQGRPAGSPGAPGSRPRTATLIAAGVIVVGLVAVTGTAVLIRGGDDGQDGAAPATSSTPSASASSGSPSATTALPSASSPATSPATEKATTSAPTSTTPAGSTHAGATYTDHGNKVLNIRKPGDATGPVLVVATHPGGGSFGVLALDSTLRQSDILINAAGRYQGTTLLDARGTQTQHLMVRASGPWTLKIKPVSAARSVDTRAKGNGDDVLRYTGATGLATFDCRGGLNFVVTYYGTRNAVLVDEVGGYHGQVPIEHGPALVSVKANAAWALTVGPSSAMH